LLEPVTKCGELGADIRFACASQFQWNRFFRRFGHGIDL
jgi:hypothetical protein